MVLYKIYSQEHRIRYFAHPCSAAVLFQIGCLLLTFLAPLFTSYFTSGFYYKELTYVEQPQVSYLGRFELMIESSTSFIFSSSDGRLNNEFLSSFYPCTISTTGLRDINGDGIADQQQFTLTVVSPYDISGGKVSLWLHYQYASNRFPLLNMETLAVVSLNVPLALSTNTTAVVYGQLCFQQRQPILSYSEDSTIQNPIITDAAYTLASPLDDVLYNYTLRNYLTSFKQQYVQWSSLSSTSTTGSTIFNIQVTVNTGPQTIRYVPSFWKEFRWSWVQYVTALLPFFYVFNKVKEFAFSNRLVRTAVKTS